MDLPPGKEAQSGDEVLIKAGWTRQFLASGSRLYEAVEDYRSIGLDVHLEPARSADMACSECQPQQPGGVFEGFYVIYTRRAEPTQGGGVKSDDDLW